MVEQNELTPSEYFDFVKGRKQTVTDEDLSKVYDNCLDLLNKYKVTGQIKGMKKLIFHLQCIEAEREIVKMGITTFIYRDDIEEYIDNVASDTVKIIELQNYEREIPDEIVDVRLEINLTNYMFFSQTILVRQKGRLKRNVGKKTLFFLVHFKIRNLGQLLTDSTFLVTGKMSIATLPWIKW